jgi:hypothetical protein
MVSPVDHTFCLLVESDTYEGLTGLLSGSIGQDHEADVVPVMTLRGAMKTLDWSERLYQPLTGRRVCQS